MSVLAEHESEVDDQPKNENENCEDNVSARKQRLPSLVGEVSDDQDGEHTNEDESNSG